MWVALVWGRAWVSLRSPPAHCHKQRVLVRTQRTKIASFFSLSDDGPDLYCIDFFARQWDDRSLYGGAIHFQRDLVSRTFSLDRDLVPDSAEVARCLEAVPI